MRAHDLLASILRPALTGSQVHKMPPATLTPQTAAVVAYDDPAREPTMLFDPGQPVWQYNLLVDLVTPASGLNAGGWDWLYDSTDAVIAACIAADESFQITEVSQPEILEGEEGQPAAAMQRISVQLTM